MGKKNFIWVEKTVFKNKKNGQYSVPLPKKIIEEFFKVGKNGNVPTKINMKIFR